MRVLSIVIAVLLLAVLGCEPRMSAIEREVRMPRLTVIQITSTPDPLATPARTVIIMSAVPTLTTEPSSAPLTPNTPAPELAATPEEFGDVYLVGNTDGDGVYIRRTYHMEDKIKAWSDGTAMVEISGWLQVGDRLWRHVVDPDGNEGYVPAKYLVPQTTDEPTHVVEPSAEPFTIIEWQDVGIGKAKRITYRIQLHRGFTEQELLALTKQVVSNHVQREEVNAIVVNFINPDGGVGSRYDTAIVWAPNGEWGDAFKVDTGDYSQHKYVVNWFTKYETPVDPELDAKRKVIFRESVAAEARAREEADAQYPPDADNAEEWLPKWSDLNQRLRQEYKQVVMDKYDLTLKELREIGSEGVRKNWPWE